MGVEEKQTPQGSPIIPASTDEPTDVATLTEAERAELSRAFGQQPPKAPESGAKAPESDGRFRVYFWADAKMLGLEPTYAGGIESDAIFGNIEMFKKWAFALARDGRLDVLKDVRVRAGQNSSEVRSICRDILDANVYKVNEGEILEAIARWGGSKWSRIVAMRKLREKSINGNSRISGVMQGIADMDQPAKYVDADIAEIATANVQALKTGDTDALSGLSDLEARKAIEFLMQSYRDYRELAFNTYKDNDVLGFLSFRDNNKDLLHRIDFMRSIFTSILRGETSVMDDQMLELRGWWTFVRKVMTFFYNEFHEEETRSYPSYPVLDGVNEDVMTDMGEILLDTSDSDLRRTVGVYAYIFDSGFIDLEVDHSDLMTILQNLRGGINHFQHAISCVKRDRPHDLAQYVRELEYPEFDKKNG